MHLFRCTGGVSPAISAEMQHYYDEMVADGAFRRPLSFQQVKAAKFDGTQMSSHNRAEGSVFHPWRRMISSNVLVQA